MPVQAGIHLLRFGLQCLMKRRSLDSGRGHDVQGIGGKVSGDDLRTGSPYEGTGGSTLSAHCDGLVRQIARQRHIVSIAHRRNE
jgi:hypothetical protein